MTLTSDTPHPQLDVPFNVTVAIQVKENVPVLQNVYLPTFFGPEELGDVRTYAHGPGGTLYRETLTLEAHARGPVRITPAYMDAVDARDRKPKRFFSNALTLVVEGGALTDFWAPVRAILTLLIYALLISAAVFVVAVMFARRRRSVPEPVTEAPTLEQVPVDPQPEKALASAVAELRERRNRACVLEVRAALWRGAGAGEGETLADVLARSRAAGDLRRVLIDAERAAFIEESRLPHAIDELLAHLDRSAFA